MRQGLVALLLLLVVWVAAAAEAILCCARRRQGVVLPYTLAGAVFGCACGGLLSYLTIALPTALKASRTFSEDHVFHRWFASPPTESLLTLAATLAMAGLWGAAAWRRWAGLEPACSWVVVVLSLIAASNLVPAWWMSRRASSEADGLLYEGSDPRTLAVWVITSYGTAVMLLLAGAILLEGLLWGLDHVSSGWRCWRRHVYFRLATMLPAFTAGFLAFWVATVMALFLFNHHGE